MEILYTTGLMGSGKSRLLIDEFEADKHNKFAFVASLTGKTGLQGFITSRNGSKIPAFYLNTNDSKYSIIDTIKHFVEILNIDVLYIDEVQFLSAEVVEEIINTFIENILFEIRFYGLETTFQNEYFSSAEYLFDIITNEQHRYILMACEQQPCSNKAAHNARLINGKVTQKGSVIVEEKSKYMALCSEHYFAN